MLNQEFVARFNGFLAAANAKREQLSPSTASYNQRKPLEAMEGQRYIRIVNVDNGRSCYCFVDKTNGNVLKSAGWKAPETKHPRSNIFDEDFGMSGLSLYGANYLK